jgi:hypothetical protein
MFLNVQNRNYFPTPFIVAQLQEKDAARINPALERCILEKEKQDVGVNISNHGGWQSDTHILEWGGEPIQFILSKLTHILNDITFVLENHAYRRTTINWRAQGWANINRNNNPFASGRILVSCLLCKSSCK